MSGPLKRHVVQRTRSLIADEQHWCRGSLAQNAKGDVISSTSAGAVKRCGLGALIAAAYELTHDFDAAHELGHMALRPLYGSATLVFVNDSRGHAAVLAMFDEVMVAV
jgi:hypothetical protein